MDTDQDGILNDVDSDDDGDGILDPVDALPLKFEIFTENNQQVTASAGVTTTINLNFNVPEINYAIIVQQAAKHGSISVVAGTNSIQYTPDPTYTGPDDFIYFVSASNYDPISGVNSISYASASATVVIDVTP